MNGISTFINTKKESKLWHYGLYEGLRKGFKIHDPRKVYDELYVSELDRKDWYAKDKHYFDFAFIAAYLVSTVVEIGLVSTLAGYL